MGGLGRWNGRLPGPKMRMSSLILTVTRSPLRWAEPMRLASRGALTKGLRGYGELINNKQAAKIIADDVVGGANIMLSVFIPEPQFQGQTKEKLASIEATKLVETSLGDHFDLWLSSDPETAQRLLEHTVERSLIRMKKRQDKNLKRQSATKRIRLPGKLSDCSQRSREGTEIFIVEATVLEVQRNRAATVHSGGPTLARKNSQCSERYFR